MNEASDLLTLTRGAVWASRRALGPASADVLARQRQPNSPPWGLTNVPGRAAVVGGAGDQIMNRPASLLWPGRERWWC